MKYLRYVALFLLLFVAVLYYRFSINAEVEDHSSWVKIMSNEVLLETIQKWRESEKLPRYKVSDVLCKIADVRLEDIWSDYTHDKLDLRASQFLKKPYTVSENIARVWEGEDATLKKWLDSPSHAKALRSNYTHTCVRTDGSNAVQLFSNL